MNATTDQRRAKAGGEYGANGEWYEGGKFIATQEDTIKRAPMVHTVTPEEIARREAAQAEHAATVARLNAWLASRREQFSAVIERLLAYPAGGTHLTREEWSAAIENGNAGFWPSIGRQLRDSGTLSEKQARYAVKAMFGRENKANREAYWTMVESLTENFK